MGLPSVSKLLLISLLAMLGVLHPGPTPEATITAFVQAVNAKDMPKAAAMVVGGKPKADYSTILSLLPKGLNISVSSMKTTIDGTKATVSLEIKMESPNTKSFAQIETANLVQYNGDLLIVPIDDSSAGRDVIGSLAKMTTGPSAIFANAKEAAKRTTCLSNLKQLALGVMIYIADHDDKFKFTEASLRKAVLTYTKNDKLWFCPSGSQTVPAYSVNTKLIGKAAAKLKDPANTVLLYEGSKGALNFRHGGYACVAFADGHAKVFKAADAKKLNWNP
jgi:prepilin-type processing-associated H-X9-DG protein